MLRFVVIACAIVAALGQNADPKGARILKEQRFNAGDGRTGSAFATDDGQVFREETDAAGNRIGQYSYIGDDGTTYTVKYSAGKDGFRILEGDHIRSTGQGAAQFAEEEPIRAPAPVQQAVPVVRQQAEPAFDYYDEEVVADPNRNPFINPHDPTHRDFAFNKHAIEFEPKNNNGAVQFNSNLVPNCADCAGVNPFINPFDASHRANPLAGHLAGHLAGAQQPAQRAQPARRPAPTAFAAIDTTTTPSPKRFFPPGQLTLNRFENGFNFDFESK